MSLIDRLTIGMFYQDTKSKPNGILPNGLNGLSKNITTKINGIWHGTLVLIVHRETFYNWAEYFLTVSPLISSIFYLSDIWKLVLLSIIMRLWYKSSKCQNSLLNTQSPARSRLPSNTCKPIQMRLAATLQTTVSNAFPEYKRFNFKYFTDIMLRSG